MRVKAENGVITAPSMTGATAVPPSDGPPLAPIAMQARFTPNLTPKARLLATCGSRQVGALLPRRSPKDGCPRAGNAYGPSAFACAGPNAPAAATTAGGGRSDGGARRARADAVPVLLRCARLRRRA